MMHQQMALGPPFIKKVQQELLVQLKPARILLVSLLHLNKYSIIFSILCDSLLCTDIKSFIHRSCNIMNCKKKQHQAVGSILMQNNRHLKKRLCKHCILHQLMQRSFIQQSINYPQELTMNDKTAIIPFVYGITMKTKTC